MAITKLLNIKSTRSGNPHSHLKRTINYILDTQHGHNMKKTNNGCLVGGNCGFSTETVLATMLETKQNYGKNLGRQGYHFVLAFPEGEVTEDVAYELTQKFCDEYFNRNDYDHVFAIHTDKAHMHAHIVFNSVNVYGKKYHYKKGDWSQHIQIITNRLCEEYGLNTIPLDDLEKKKKQDLGYATFDKKSKKHNWNKIMREDIDYIIKHSNSYTSFLEQMQQEGYNIRSGFSTKGHHEYFSMKTEGMGKARRNYYLGKDYEVEQIKFRIQNKYLIETVEEKTLKSPRVIKATKIRPIYYYKMAPIKKQFIKKIFKVYRTRNRFVSPYPQACKYKKDLVELDRLMDNYNFVIDNKINTVHDLTGLLEEVAQKKNILSMTKRRLLTQSNVGDSENQQLKNVSSELKYLNIKHRKAKRAIDMCVQFSEDEKSERAIKPEKSVGQRKGSIL